MKNTKTCPKCSSTSIVRIDGFAGPHGNNIPAGATFFSQITVNVNRYVCCQCGYTEEWIDREDLPKIVNSKIAKSI